MIKVYWTRSYPKHEDLMKMGLNPKAMMSGLRIPAPQPLLEHLDYKEFFGPVVSKCPAIIDDLKNVLGSGFNNVVVRYRGDSAKEQQKQMEAYRQ